MSHLNRRTFLKASAAVFAAPMIVPSSCFGANERVTIGTIGLRAQGSAVMRNFLNAGCNLAALCDVDSDILGKAKVAARDSFPSVKLYGDYRKMLEQKDIDAVIVGTPDHWHALMTIDACQAGKDVYCEKPLSLTIAEGRRMTDTARREKRIVQTGSQQRSSEGFWKACMLARNGKIGKLQQILVGIPIPNAPKTLPPDSNPPANLDYDTWLGPAPLRPYNEARVHYNFRFWWDYSGGQITNFGAHNLDIAQWALDADNSGPSAVRATATFNDKHLFEVTETCRIAYDFPNDVEVVLVQGDKSVPTGVTLIGTDGKIEVTRKRLVSNPPEIANLDVNDLPIQLPRSTDHAKNFLNCIKTRELPICDVEIGHRAATVCHLGNISVRLGRPLKWDPKTEKIIGDDEAQAMVDRPYRAPWSHAGV